MLTLRECASIVWWAVVFGMALVGAVFTALIVLRLAGVAP